MYLATVFLWTFFSIYMSAILTSITWPSPIMWGYCYQTTNHQFSDFMSERRKNRRVPPSVWLTLLMQPTVSRKCIESMDNLHGHKCDQWRDQKHSFIDETFRLQIKTTIWSAFSNSYLEGSTKLDRDPLESRYIKIHLFRILSFDCEFLLSNFPSLFPSSYHSFDESFYFPLFMSFALSLFCLSF